MVIYVAGATAPELAAVEDFCEQHGWALKVLRRNGRPRANVPVQKVLDTYKRLQKVRATARFLGIHPGHVSRVVAAARARGEI